MHLRRPKGVVNLNKALGDKGNWNITALVIRSLYLLKAITMSQQLHVVRANKNNWDEYIYLVSYSF